MGYGLKMLLQHVLVPFEMELLVNPLPSPVTPTPLIECDLDNDDFIAFDLESKNTEILDGEPGVIISYHETRPEAEEWNERTVKSLY